MLFNLDRNLKQSILAEYKKEALLHQEKKQLEKQQKIKEEQEYLDKLNKQDEQTLQKLREEEEIRKNNQKKYYDQIFNSPDKNARKKELIIKIWERNDSHPTPLKENNIFRKEANNKYEVDYNVLSPLQRQKMYIRKGDDHMNKYLTDEQNNKELSNYLKEEKDYRQKYYRDLINSQFEEAQRINKDRYGTNDILIIENKRKRYFNENQYSPNKKYFGKSNLLHNPIVNPENNLGYNKYINFRLNKSNIFKNKEFTNLNNSNDINELNNNKNNSSELYTPNKRTIKIENNNNYKDFINIHKTETNATIDGNNNSNDKKLNLNNYYGRFSDNNIFDYRKKAIDVNSINKSSSNKNIYENNNNYEFKNNNQIGGSILSQAAKSNFMI
jgi:hypothetical protein